MKSSGQAVLLILLVVAVALGLGLSIMSQSTTDIRMSQQEQESARAFSAAEAGIEDALKAITVGSGNLTVDGIDVNYTVTGQQFLQGRFPENGVAQVILDGNENILTIEWVEEGDPVEDPGTCVGKTGEAPASLLISVINSDYEVRRVGINACVLRYTNNLEDISDFGDFPYLRRYNLEISDGDQLVRIRPVYNSTSLQVTADPDSFDPLPDQAYLISSSAQIETTKEAKAIEVTRLEPAAPPIFDYVLFSGGNLDHL